MPKIKVLNEELQDNILKKVSCSPNPSNDKLEYSCYTSNKLLSLQNMWNKRHPYKQINFTDPYKIWQFLKEKYKKLCETEACWLKQEFFDTKLSKEFLYYFAQSHPVILKYINNT